MVSQPIGVHSTKLGIWVPETKPIISKPKQLFIWLKAIMPTTKLVLNLSVTKRLLMKTMDTIDVKGVIQCSPISNIVYWLM